MIKAAAGQRISPTREKKKKKDMAMKELIWFWKNIFELAKQELRIKEGAKFLVEVKAPFHI